VRLSPQAARRACPPNIHRREALRPPPRPASPTWEADESTDTIVLDPELANIAAAARSRVISQGSLPGDDGKHGVLEQGGGPENVTIRVRWRPHPLDPDRRPSLMVYKLKRVRGSLFRPPPS